MKIKTFGKWLLYAYIAQAVVGILIGIYMGIQATL